MRWNFIISFILHIFITIALQKMPLINGKKESKNYLNTFSKMAAKYSSPLIPQKKTAHNVARK